MKKYTSLAAYLKETGTTHEALATKLRISRPYVTLIASGERQPSLGLAVRIEKVTGVPAASMVSTEAA